MGAAAPLLDLSGVLSIGATLLVSKPPYCFRAAAPGSFDPMLFAMKAGIMGFVGDCTGPTENVFWTTGATSGLDLLMNGDPGSGMSGGGMNLIAVGALGGAFHCFSSSVPLKMAGMVGTSFEPFLSGYA